MVSIPSRSMDQNYMEGLVTCYIRNECKRSAVRGGNSAGTPTKKVVIFSDLKRFQAISSNFKPTFTHAGTAGRLILALNGH